MPEHEDEIDKCLKEIKSSFPKSFVYKEDELIIEPKNNIYFRIDDISTELDFKCKVVEWLSRPACKGLSKSWQVKIRNGVNQYLGTSFDQSDMLLIYTHLGCRVNHGKTVAFVKSGYDLGVLK